MIDHLDPDFRDLPGCRALPRNYVRGAETCAHIDVSIITPYYNTEAFFAETFVSLQGQSLQNWEWVIVDDGSTDQESIDRLAQIASKDDRIKVIRQQNAGPGAARNTAARNSSGRYLCLLDSDDMVEPTYLEKAAWFLDSNPEFTFCNSYSVVFGEQEYLWTTGFERGKAHLKANSGPPISVIRRSAFEDCGGFDESIRFGHEDWDFWLAMANAGHWGYTIREYIQWYRKRGNGRFEHIMRSSNVNDEFEKLMHRKYEGLDKHFPEPSRRQSEPFESIETTSLLDNPLASNPTGRRIMFIVPWMVTGGADRVNLDLIEGLVSTGHDITVCATLQTDHSWAHQFSRFTPDIFVLPNFLHASDYPRFLAYLIQSRKIDSVVITGSTIGYQFLPYLRAVSPGVAFVDMSHVEELHWLNGGHPRFGVGYQDALDLNIVTTRHLAEWMEGRGADRARIRVMYSGVRSARATRLAAVRDRVRAELDIPADVPVIVFAGRICEQKRPGLLASILKAARDQGLTFQALVLGEGELKDQLETLLDQYQLADRVHTLGSVSHDRWLDILVASDVLLMPSQYEGISIALLEAMAAGVVPIVAKVGGQAEIVSPGSGMLIPHGASELQEYVDAVSRLITAPDRLRAMSETCRSLASSKFSWEETIQNFQAILEEAHRLLVQHPRHPVSPGLGKELATLSLEYKRLGEAVDWLWNAKPHAGTGDVGLVNPTAEAQAVARFAILVSQTWLVRNIIQNRLVRIWGGKLIRMMARPNAA